MPVVIAMCFTCLSIQENHSLLGDEEIYACALVSSSFLDFLSLGSEHISPEQTVMHGIWGHCNNVLLIHSNVKQLQCTHWNRKWIFIWNSEDRQTPHKWLVLLYCPHVFNTNAITCHVQVHQNHANSLCWPSNGKSGLLLVSGQDSPVCKNLVINNAARDTNITRIKNKNHPRHWNIERFIWKWKRNDNMCIHWWNLLQHLTNLPLIFFRGVGR